MQGVQTLARFFVPYQKDTFIKIATNSSEKTFWTDKLLSLKSHSFK